MVEPGFICPNCKLDGQCTKCKKAIDVSYLLIKTAIRYEENKDG